MNISNKNQISSEFISKIPKSDLHVHIDGSLRVTTIIELCKQAGAYLPSYTEAGLHELVFKDQYQNLLEYLQGFGYVYPILQTPENLERISYEFAMDCIAEGVCYVEPQFAPQLHINNNQDINTVLTSVNKGLNRAKIEYNNRPAVKSGELPKFNYGIIVCAMRFFCKGMCAFYDNFLESHKHLTLRDTLAKAAYELSKDCIAARDKYDIPIMAFNIAGAEAGYPAAYFKDAYDLALKNFMHLTTHAGEASGPESIYQALFELHTDRIGHGFHLFAADQIADATIIDKKRFVNQLVEYIATTQKTIEICLTSNLQTIPELKNINNHPFAKMLEAELSTTICTDNRTVSKTTLTKELTLALQNFNLDRASFKKLIMRGFEKSFYPGSYKEKQQYISKILKSYELLEKQYLTPIENNV